MRLSRLQKWILTRIFKNNGITRHVIREFYGKPLSEPMTASERAAISRSLKGLFNKGLITLAPERQHRLMLTTKGQQLKVIKDLRTIPGVAPTLDRLEELEKTILAQLKQGK